MAISFRNTVGKIECGSPAEDFFAVHTNAQSSGGTPHRAARILFEEYAAQLRMGG